MKKHTVIDKRTVHLEKILSADYIPFLGGRPQREAVIGSDDVINVQILLNTVKSVEDFLAAL